MSELIENDDGSCSCRMELSQEETRILLEYAVVHLLKDLIQREPHLKEGVNGSVS